MTSRGGFTFGIALPENALTVDSYEYIGLIVRYSQMSQNSILTFTRLDLPPMAQDGPVSFRETTPAQVCRII